MIVRTFLLWAQHAAAGRRAEAAAALARAVLYGDLSPADRRDAETALAALLDDASPLVRRALAEAFAGAAEAPRHLVVALANDQGDVAALVLARSPALTDADLVDCAALGCDLAREAIAARPSVSVGVSAALAEIAGPDALAILLANPGATLAASSLMRALERHGDDGRVREAMLARDDLPVDVRQAVAARLAASLQAFVVGCGWLTRERGARVVREARDRATLALPGSDEVGRLVAHLRRSGQLTASLVLRAALSGRMDFAEAALADLAELPAQRVSALLHDGRGVAVAALYRRAGLPPELFPAFDAALSAWREGAAGAIDAEGARLSRLMIERALTACESMPFDEARAVLSLLARFDAEAAREEARAIGAQIAREAALEAVLDAVPAGLLDSYRAGRAQAA
jgi:uncharacterized protein (DUF2336 family)